MSVGCQQSGHHIIGAGCRRHQASAHVPSSSAAQLSTAHLAAAISEGAIRAQIDAIVFPALSTELSEEQKRNKVKNLLAQLNREHEIHYEPKGEKRGWSLG